MAKKQQSESCESFEERRQSVVERRMNMQVHEGEERRSNLERRRGPGIRRSEERKAAEEGQMNDEQFEFLMAIDNYKRKNNKPFPSWTEVLEVVKALGYRKVAEERSIESFKEEPVGAN
jgi:hypothetical protein